MRIPVCQKIGYFCENMKIAVLQIAVTKTVSIQNKDFVLYFLLEYI